MYLKLILCVFIIVSLINSYLDLRTMHISIILNYIGIIACVVLYLLNSPKLFINNLMGSLILFFIFILVRLIAHKGLGWGDIHYSLFCGLVSGVPGFIFSALMASISGLIIFFIIKIRIGSKSIKQIRVPFIPMMFLGTCFGLVANKLFEKIW
ncbi:Type IV leader peptidase family protein [Treponema bryantii]|uniref:Type IV leader peptidase family protein n=1 Tax=Treponema bryantii TaxID=163 RepID=A0A1H9JSZ1_9SPIR|nr:prepilin peptidase [Treponema bryantii]SEQ89942.1 Type IV leader peptidase family protein [Treponema bryantii]